MRRSVSYAPATPEDLERWQAAAKAEGRPLSQWVRWVLNQASTPTSGR